MSLDPDENRKKFEELGEEKVRDHIARHTFKPERIRLAEQWLAQKAQARADNSERSRQHSTDENIRIARSAKNAAWIAAIAAVVAAIAALSALIR
jgi:hypothetical protein